MFRHCYLNQECVNIHITLSYNTTNNQSVDHANHDKDVILQEPLNDNEMTMTMKYLYLDTYLYKIYFTSAYVLITLVIKTYMCPGDLISAKLCRYHKATKIISKYVLQ